jgi:proteasome lid subunit RPN8/RPN11
LSGRTVLSLPGDPVTVYISQNAFWGLLISAVEVYKRECFGLLIGYRDRRSSDEIERFLENIPHLSVIGDFHSHTMWGISRAASHPSETDRQGMSPRNVYVIVSVNDRLREVPWSYNDDASLSGTTDDHYFRITAYTVTSAGETRRAPILCPYALGFDARPLRAIK